MQKLILFNMLKTMIHLKSSDGKIVYITVEGAQKSELLKSWNVSAGSKVDLGYTSDVLETVAAFCMKTDRTDAWDWQFGKCLSENKELLFDVLLAANYLNIKPLIHVCSRQIAEMVKRKTPEQIGEIFRIPQK